ncbi:hypothetical protein [Pseudonocardia sp. WMMC193]|uniref:hypothetical protein n=1 Tax=Pseudonocardia sp. WMMC193 TaxID=2911965 RepID=UPI001F31681F|nr:hypothetical protein [Pseudonocardia sp. WMMC193]MCF7548916.1 hypothetical protein [Pseudonocardia sp. WMMC193]
MAVEAERSGGDPADAIPRCARCAQPDMFITEANGLCTTCEARAEIIAADGKAAWDLWVSSQATRTAPVIPIRRPRRGKADLALVAGDVGVYQVADRPLREEEQANAIFSTAVCTNAEHEFHCDAMCEAG